MRKNNAAAPFLALLGRFSVCFRLMAAEGGVAAPPPPTLAALCHFLVTVHALLVMADKKPRAIAPSSLVRAVLAASMTLPAGEIVEPALYAGLRSAMAALIAADDLVELDICAARLAAAPKASRDAIVAQLRLKDEAAVRAFIDASAAAPNPVGQLFHTLNVKKAVSTVLSLDAACVTLAARLTRPGMPCSGIRALAQAAGNREGLTSDAVAVRALRAAKPASFKIAQRLTIGDAFFLLREIGLPPALAERSSQPADDEPWVPRGGSAVACLGEARCAGRHAFEAGVMSLYAEFSASRVEEARAARARRQCARVCGKRRARVRMRYGSAKSSQTCCSSLAWQRSTFRFTRRRY